MKIIVISGKAGSGKSFLASNLKAYLEEVYGKKGYIINFGDPLKMVATKLYGWNGEKGENGRKLLQQIGTDIAQKNNQMVWVNIIIEIIEALRSEYDFVIIGDCRFIHEMDGISNYFMSRIDIVYDIKIIGPENNLSETTKYHPSETQLDLINDARYDYIFDNKNHNLYRFFHQLSLIINDIME